VNSKTKKFIGIATHHLISKGVSIHLVPKDKIEKCNGYFDDNVPILKVATGKPEKKWLPIFAHEYCHFLQWQDKNFDDSFVNWDAWEEWDYGEKKIKREDIVPVFYDLRNIELDCEKRVLKLISQYDLPINRKDYIKRANVYGLFYNVLAKRAPKYGTGKWYKVAPYDVPEIINIVPGNKIGLNTRTPKKFVELVEKHCF
jgi:hypothetical protein